MVQGAITTIDELGTLEVASPAPSLDGLRQQLHAAQAALRDEQPAVKAMPIAPEAEQPPTMEMQP